MTEKIDLRMAEAIKLAKIAFFSYSFDGTILAIDRVAFDFFELEGIFKNPQSVVGKNIETLFVYIGPKGRIRKEIRTKRRISNLEYGIRTLKNTEKWGIHNSYIYIDKKTGEEAIQVCFYDITDRKLHEVETDNQYKILVENSIEVIWKMDLEGNFTYISPSVEMLRGYSVEEAMNLSLEETLTPESFSMGMAELQKWLSKPTDELPFSFTVELEQFRKNGTTVWTLVTIKPVFDDDGEIIELQGGTLDITQRKKTEEALKSQHERFHTILDKYPEYLYVADPKTHELLFVNQKLRDLTGRPMVGGTCYKEVQGMEEPCDFCTNELILKTRMPHVWEHENKNLNRDLLITDQIIQWPDGRDVRFETAVDITDRKRIEKILQDSEYKYNSFIEQSSYGFFVLDKQGNVTYLNDKARELTGAEFKENETIGFADFLSPEEYDTATKNLRAIARGKNFDASRVYNIRRTDGEMRKMEVQTLPIKRDDELVGFHGTLVDITQRIRFEEELSEKTKFLDAVVNNTHDGIFVVDEDFNYIFINPASGRIMGQDPEEWIGKRAGTKRHPDDDKVSFKAVSKAMNGEPSTCEVRIMHSSGKYHLLEVRYSLMMMGDKPNLLGMVSDITERRRLESFRNITYNIANAVIENSNLEDFYRYIHSQISKVLNARNFYISLYDPLTNALSFPYYVDEHGPEIIDASKSFRVLGKGLTEYTLKKGRGIRLNSKQIKELEKIGEIEIIGSLPKQWVGVPLKADARYIGVIALQDYKKSDMYSEQDLKFLEFISGQIAIAIERKHWEMNLWESEEKYRNLFEYSPESIIILNLEGKIMECNKATSKLTELEMDEIIGRRFDELGILDRQQTVMFIDRFKSMTRGNGLNTEELEIIMKSGHSKWIEISPSLIKQEGKINAIQLIIRDITDRKVAEIKMRKNLMKFELDRGNVYLSKEPRASQSLDAFRELLMVGNAGTLISRKIRKEFQNEIEYSFNHIQIAETGKENHVLPSYKAIHEMLSNIPIGQIIHIDCIDYLASRIGPKRTLNLVQYLKDLAITKHLIVLLSVDSRAMSEKDMRLIEKESMNILPSESLTKLPSKLLDMLIYIDRQNREGTMPSYSEIGKYFHLSKPTARRRIRWLEELGTVKEIQRGRKKILELTEKGKNYVTP